MRIVLQSPIRHPFVCCHLAQWDSACRIPWHKIPGMTSVTAWASPQVVITTANVPTLPTLRVEVDSKAGEWHRRYHDLEHPCIRCRPSYRVQLGQIVEENRTVWFSIWKKGPPRQCFPPISWLVYLPVDAPDDCCLKPKRWKKESGLWSRATWNWNDNRVVGVLWRGRCKMRGRSCQNITGKGG